jgi:hypothetical protein
MTSRVSAPATAPSHNSEKGHKGGPECDCLAMPDAPAAACAAAQDPSAAAILTKTGTPRPIDQCARIMCGALVLLESTKYKVPFGKYTDVPASTRLALENAFSAQQVSFQTLPRRLASAAF